MIKYGEVVIEWKSHQKARKNDLFSSYTQKYSKFSYNFRKPMNVFWFCITATAFLILTAEELKVEDSSLMTGLNYSSPRCDIGKWVNVDEAHVPFPTKYARNVYMPQNSQESDNLFLAEACEAQVLIYSCYYHEGHPDSIHHTGRAHRIEYSRWKSSNENCWNPMPSDFAEAIDGRSVLFLGDSVMHQIYATFVCNMASHVPMKYTVEFHGAVHKNIMCPFGAPHCHFISSAGKFARSGHIRTGGTFTYTPKLFEQTVFEQMQMTTDDLVIMNIGLHYNERAKLQSDLKAFFHELTELRSRKGYLPHILFFQTTPQHFHTPLGYYNKSHSSDRCHDFASTTYTGTSADFFAKMEVEDWRNADLQVALHTYNRHFLQTYTNMTSFASYEENLDVIELSGYVHLVRVARPLYSKWDAHVDLTPFFYFTEGDCTHWCTPSGIFHYIHRAMYNALVDVLGVRKKYIQVAIASIKRHYPDETLLRGSSKSVFVMKDGRRYAFYSFNAFASRGYDFANVRAISDMNLEEIPLGGNLY